LDKKLQAIFGKSLMPLGELADVICGPFGSAITNKDYQESGIPLIRITNISRDGYMDYSDIIYISEELGNSLSRTQVSAGDIVISQRGSLGQCAIVDDTFAKLNISANIIAIKNPKGISAGFIRNYILSAVGQTLLERASSGQVQQKITTQDIANLLIPNNCDEEKLTSIIESGYVAYRSEIKRADKLLQDFEFEVSKIYDLSCSQDSTLCYAVKLGQIDGVIDAKRYASKLKSVAAFTVCDVCDVLDKKVNVAHLGTQIIDWIRIDDLPNQPLDIKEVRTQPANEVEGTFFEVEEGDILVARLGPTILNQKIVMVRSLERTTIASAEFLVLRCKKGYNAEAVMAVLKTAYYRDLMYSHARGSTPSRYRLNKEDMLKLPFPGISERQEQIAAKANEVRNQVKFMRIQAELNWKAAKEQFEKELLGE